MQHYEFTPDVSVLMKIPMKIAGYTNRILVQAPTIGVGKAHGVEEMKESEAGEAWDGGLGACLIDLPESLPKSRHIGG